MIIIKRDGISEEFKPYKIKDAIMKAFESVNQPYDETIFNNVMEILKQRDVWAVEEIQDIIEKELFNARYFEVMRSFMLYRHTRKLQREHIFGLNDDTTYIDCSQTVEEYISGKDWRVNANSNMGYSHAGLINYIAGKVIANYWLDKVYSKEAGYAHRNGDIHIHDLDNLSGYCAGWSLRQLLNEGFNGVRGRVESKSPKHFREALGQMANFLGVLQSEWAGAQSFSSFDTYLAPYVFKDKLSYTEVKKAIRSFIYNLNVPSRWGQSPFTNITLDWTVPQDLTENWPTVNDRHLFEGVEDKELLEKARERGVEKLTDLRYKHFQREMNMINRAFYEVMNEGDKAGQPFTFPIPTVNITEDFDWDGENTDVLFENTAKLGTSYFQNFIGSQYIFDENGNKVRNPDAFQPYMVRSMCCRLQLDLRELLKRGNGLFGSAEMTGSIGVVTINMARLGYRFKKNKEDLLKELERLLEIAKDTLERKRKFIQDLYDRGLYPYTKRYLPSFRNHFSTIGVNGMNEMIRNFTDDEYDITDKRGIDFAKEILDFIREKIVKFQKETGNLYNLEATPAEGATYRFAKEDKKRFPDIITAGDGENIYYTNSSQVPANFNDDPFEVLKLQDDLQCKYTGGTVLHIYLKEGIQDKDSCKQLLKKILTNFKLPYVTITPLITVCPKHGRLEKNYEYCPKCDEEILEKYLLEVE
ncbi:MAG: ribonucleoside triphosphate reductase [Hydrogenothermaceae bacterium]